VALERLEEPTPYAIVNGTWQWRGDAPLLRYAAAFATVLGVVEARTRLNEPVDVRKILRHPIKAARRRIRRGLRRPVPGYDAGWRVSQDVTDGATAGTAIAIRRGGRVRLKRFTTWISNRAGSTRRGAVQTRWGHVAHLVDHGIRTRVIVLHWATLNSGQQHQSRASLRRAVRRAERAGVRWIVLADVNTDPAVLARELGAAGSHRHGVMAIIWGAPDSAVRDGRGWGRMATQVLHHDATDHVILTATETHRRVPDRLREVPA
jgi:hypothetical protein